MNEITQQIKFFTSKLNWDVDISLLQNGDSKYNLNVMPESSEHAGVRTNCLGTTEKTLYVANASHTDVTVTETSVSDTVTRFAFDVAAVPNVLEIEFLHNGVLEHLYISGSGYSDVSSFRSYVVAEFEKLFYDKVNDSGIATNTIRFDINIVTGDEVEMLVRTRTTTTYPTSLRVVGAFYDKLQNVTYYWVYDSSGTVKLLQFANRDGVIINLPISDLDVMPYSVVSNPFAIGTGRDRLLYWTYRNGTAHKINVYKCLTGDIAYSYATSFSLIKKPFSEEKVIYQNVDTDYRNFNKYFQLLTRAKYLDKEKSVFSGLSPLIYPSEYTENSIGLSGTSASKRYELTGLITPTGVNPDFDEFEYAIKQNNGNWSLVELATSATYSNRKELTGDEATASLAPSDVNRLFDYVPQQIGSQLLINNNRLVLADCVEGYENVDLDVETEEVENEIDEDTIKSSAFVFPTESVPHNELEIIPPVSGQSATHVVYIKTLLDEYIIKLTDDYGMSTSDVIDYFVDYIDNNIVGVDPEITGVSNQTTKLRIEPGYSYTIYAKMASYVKTRCFKEGTTHHLGIVYYDEYGRCGGVNVSEDTSIHIPYYLGTGSTGAVDIKTHLVKLTINHTPPIWAHSYRLFYGGSGSSWYQQLVIKNTELFVNEKEIKIYTNNVITEGLTINSAFNMGSYVFNKGDRIRILGAWNYITETVGGITSIVPGVLRLGTDYYDAEILSQDEEAVYISKPSNTDVLDFITDDSTLYGRFLLVELYKPIEAAPVEYFETPYYGTILNPGEGSRSHDYLIYSINRTAQNTTLSTPMECTIYGFDHYILQTFYINGGRFVTMPIESESFSNYFNSKTKGLGRVNFYSPDFNKIRRNIVRASNIYIPNTEINGLSTFEYANEMQVDDQYGKITDIKLVGDVLKIIQPHKISSMYLGAQMAADASGNEVLLYSDKILTTPRYNVMSYGCIHPESIQVCNQQVFALDAVNAVVWKDTTGGTVPISAQGMKSYFRTKIKTLVASCGYSFKAYGCYDDKNDMYFLTFVDPTDSDNNETLAYHVPSEGWYGFYSFIPEMYCAVSGREIISFNGGKLYVHDSNTRNTFYGTTYDSYVWVVGNQYPDNPKKWNSLVVNANTPWNAEDNTGIVIDSDEIEYTDPQNYTRHRGAMVSRIKESQFRYYNGDYIAEFLRDATTTSSSFTVEDLRNGRPLVGKTILVKLKNTSTDAVYLRGVRLNAQVAR